MKKIRITAMLLAIFLLSGCSNYSAEINDKAYIIAMGVAQGENGLLKVTFMFAYPSGNSSESGGEKIDEKDIVTVEAPSIYSAMRLLDTFKSKRIDTNHTKLIAFSQEVAEKRGVFSFITDMVNTRGFRPSIYVCISQQDPDKLFKSMDPKQDSYIEKYIEHLFSKAADNGTSRAYLYNSYFSIISNDGSYVLPLVGVTDKKEVKEAAKDYPYKKPDDFALNYTADEIPLHGDSAAALSGYAVFVDNRMVGTLGLMESTIVKILEKNVFVGQFCVLVPETDHYANVDLRQISKPTITVDTGQVPTVNIDIKLWGEYTGINSNFKSQEDYDRFVNYLNTAFAQKVSELMERTRTEFGADILGFGDRSKLHFLRYQDWVAYDWKEKYKSAQFNVTVNVDMNDYGELEFSP